MNEIFNDIPCVGVGYNTTAAATLGAPIAVGRAATVSNQNFALVDGAFISGVVRDSVSLTPIAGQTVELSMQSGSGGTFVTSRQSGNDGYFSFAGLTAGTYFLNTSGKTGHQNEIYNNIPCGASACTNFGSAAPIPLALGAPFNTGNFDLDPIAGGLRGKVTSSATGLPLAGITVSLYQRVGSGVFVASTVTNYRGNYFFDSLPGGTYVVFTSNSLGYRDEIYNDSVHRRARRPPPRRAAPPSTSQPRELCRASTSASMHRQRPGRTNELPRGDDRHHRRLLLDGAGLQYHRLGHQLRHRRRFRARRHRRQPPGRDRHLGHDPERTAGHVLRAGPRGQLVRVQSAVERGEARHVARGPGAARTAQRGTGVHARRPADHDLAAAAARRPGHRLPCRSRFGDGLARTSVTVPVPGRSLTFSGVPNGFYFLRVRATNAGGVSAPSAEVIIVVGGVPSPPGAPNFTTSTASGGTVTLSWIAPLVGTPTSYIIEAGSATGLSNLAVVNTDSTATTVSFPGVPPGIYYIRLRAVNALGASVVSNERTLIVP